MLKLLSGSNFGRPIYSYFLCILFAFALFPTTANAAVVTWDGGGVDNNWDTQENWSGDTVPGGGDDVVFDATSVKNVTINVPVGVGSITVAATYSGIITQNAGVTVSASVGGYSQAAGTFTGSNSALSFAHFNLSGGTFTSTSATLTVSGNFVQSAGTFNHSNGTVAVSSNSFGATHSIDPISNLYNLTLSGFDDDTVVTFDNSFTIANNLTISASGNNNEIITITGAGNPTLTVNGNLVLGSSTADLDITANFSIVLQGNFSISDSDVSISTPITFTGTNAQTISRTAGGVSGNWEINKASNTVSAATNFASSVNLTLTSGAFSAVTFTFSAAAYVQNGGTFTGGTNTNSFSSFNLTSGTFNATSNTLTVAGSFLQTNGTAFVHNSGTVNITNTGSISPEDSFNNLTISGGTVTIARSFSVASNLVTSGGTVGGSGTEIVTVTGNLTVSGATLNNTFSISLNGNFSSTSGSTSAGITFTGTNAQTISRTFGSVFGNWEIDKSSNSVSASTAFLSFANLELTNGIFNTNNNQVQFAHVTQNSGTFNGGTNTITVSSLTLTNGTFDSTSGTLIVNGDFDQSGGTFDHSSGTVNIAADSVALTNSIDPLNNFHNLTLSGFDDDGYVITFERSFTVEGNLTASTSGSSPDEVSVVGAGNPTITILGNLSFPSSGSADFTWNNSFSIDLRGNLSMSESDLFLQTNILFSGNNAQTLSRTAGSATGTWTINKGANGVTAITNFLVFADLVITNTQFNANGNQVRFADVTQNGGSFLGSTNTITINSLTLNNGTFDSTSGTLIVNGDFVQSGGTFDHSSGTVNIAPDSVALTNSIDPLNNFHNLTLSGFDDDGYVITFERSFTVEGNLTASTSGSSPDEVSVVGAGNPTITILGNLSFPSSGSADFTWNNSFSIDLRGNLSMSENDLFLQTNILFSGNNAQTLSRTAGSATGTWTINKGANGVTAITNFLVFADLVISNSQFDANNLQVQFDEVTQNGGTFTGGNNTVTVTTLNLNNGTFNSTSGIFYVSRNFLQSGGTFNHNNGTVENRNTGTVSNRIDPIDNFYNFVLSGFDDDSVITFESSFTVANNFTASAGGNNNETITVTGLGSPTITILGNLSLGSSTADYEFTNNFAIDLRGNFSISDSDVSIATPITFTGTNAQTITRTFGSITGIWTINKASNTVTPTANFTKTAAITIDSGTLSANGFNISAGSIVINNGGVLQLRGSETITSPTSNTGAIVRFTGDGDTLADTYTVSNLAVNYYHLEILSSDGATDTFVLAGDITMNGNFELLAGIFDVTAAGCAGGSCDMAVRGDWIRDGTFVERTGTVTFDGTGAQTINDSNTWHGLHITAAVARTVRLESGVTQSINASGDLALEGSGCRVLTLAPLTAASPWNIDVADGTVTQSISRVAVSYSNATGEAIDANDGTVSDDGNNVNWTFGAEPGACGPLPTISSVAPNPTNTSPIAITIQFDQSVTGFAVGDLSVGNGSAGGFVAVDGDTYTANITPTGQGLVTVDIAAAAAQNVDGDTSLAATQFTRTFDTVAPTVAISSGESSPTNDSPFGITIEFSENVSGFVVGDITVGNGSAGNFVAVDGNTYTANITPSAQGVVTVNVAGSVAQDGAGNNNTAAPQFSITYDSVVPTVAITSSESSPTNDSPIPITIEFSENVTGFVVGEISVGNGSAGNFVAVDGNTYTADITPTGQGTVTVNVAGAVAQDGAGNDNSAAPQFSITYDSVAPTVAISSSESSPTNNSPIPITIEFSENVTGFVVGEITVGNGTAGNFAAVDGNTYTADITPTGQGAVTVNVAGAVAQDGAGNNNTAAPQFSITYDTAGPTVAITSSESSPTNDSPIPITIEFSENVTGFVVGEITVGNGTAGNFAAVDGNTYTANITPTGQGAVTVNVAGAVAQDGAGNDNSAAPQFSITYDSVAPTVAITSSESSPTNNSPIPITIEFSENVTGFVVGEITVGNGTAGNFAAVDGNTYTANITPTGQGAVTVNVAGAVAQDGAGNDNSAAPQFSITYDSVAPTVAITSSESSPTNNSPIPVTIEFSENVTGFVVGEITVGNGTAGNFAAVDGNTYTADVTPTGQGAVTVNVAGAVAQDGAGNDNSAAPQFSITYDSVAPTVAITSSESSPTNNSPIPVTIEFSENVTGFVVGEITVGNGAAGNFAAVDGNTYTADITPTGQGAVTVNVAGAVAQDGAGNNNTAAPQFSITYDSAAPTVAITSSESSPTNNSPIPVTIEFSENVTGFVVGEITVGNGTAGNFAAVDGNTYTADITPTGQGAVTVNVAGAVAQDSSGNNNTAAPQLSITYDTVAPTVAISSGTVSPTNISPIPITIEFSENVTGFVVGEITVGNGTAGNFVAVDGNTYTADITPTVDGVVTVDIAGAVAADAAGNDNSAAPQFSITYDTTIPTVVITSTAVSPTKNAPIPIVIEFSENVVGFILGDISVGNGSVANFVAVDGNTYTADITPTADGVVTVDVPIGVAQDIDGNDNVAATQYSIIFDATAPSAAISSSEASPTNNASIPITIEFSENVSDFVAGDVSVVNGSIGSFVAVDGNTYSAVIVPIVDGVVTVDVAAAVAQDSAGNNNSAALQFSISYDGSRPTVVITSSKASPTSDSPIPITITFNEDVSGFVLGDITVSNGSAGSFSTVNARTYSASITPSGEGTVKVNIAEGVAADSVGNTNFAASQFSIVYQPYTGQTFSARGKLYYENKFGDKTLFFEKGSRSSGNADNDSIHDIWVEAYRHNESGKKILEDTVKVRRSTGGEGISSFVFDALPATPTDENGNLITRTIRVRVGSNTQQVEQVVGSYTFVIRSYDNNYSVSRNFRLDTVDNRIDTDPTSVRFGQKLLGCETSEVGTEEWLSTSEGLTRKDARCLFDPLILDQNLSNLDQVVNGCVHDSDDQGIIIERQMGEDRTCYVTRDRTNPSQQLKPSNPSNLMASQGSNSAGVSLAWDASERVDYYRVYRSQYLEQNENFAAQYEQLRRQGKLRALQQLVFNGEIVGSQVFPVDKNAATMTFVDKTAVPGVHYDYVVRAFNPAGKSSYSNIARGWRYIAANVQDRDGDGVTDEIEFEDGTDPEDPGSYITRLRSPAYVKYNTYFGQLNWLELLASGSRTVDAEVTIYDSNGNTIGQPLNVSIAPSQRVDLDIHKYVPSDSYGIVRVKFNDDEQGVSLQGQISNFRLSPNANGRHSFALSRELKNFDKGALYATSNSIDPQGMGNLVANWLEISNHDSVPRRFTQRIYDIDGVLLYDSEQDFDDGGNRKGSITVPAFGEVDVQAGHEFGEGVYLVEIFPHDGATKYSASVVRYSYKTSMFSSALDFNFAVPLPARKGGAQSMYLSASNQTGECWNQSNWVEIVNTRAAPVTARFDLFNSVGELVGSSNLMLNAFGQQHINAGALLGVNDFGYVEVVSDSIGSIIAQGGNYYHDCNDNSLQTASVLEARRLAGVQQLSSFNTFLGMNNLLSISNPFNEELLLTLEVIDFDRYQEKQYQIAPHSSMQLDLSNFAEFNTRADSYGVVFLSGNQNRRFFVQNLRQRAIDSRLDFSVPSTVH